MAVNSETTCDAVTGSAAPFVAYVQVLVDGEVVATRTHEATDDGPWWSFSFSLALKGDHVVQVWDRTAGNDYWDEASNLHESVSLSCAVPETTQATTTTVAPDPTVTVALEPSTTVTTTTLVVLNTAPQPRETTETLPEPVGCCSDWVGDTTAEVPVTLPATGSTSGPMLGVGAVLLAFGLVAVCATRRT